MKTFLQFLLEDIRRPKTVIWVIHPEKGLLFKAFYQGDKAITHAEWFEQIGLPHSGAAFDNLSRGRFELFPKDRQVILLHHKRQETPTRVWQAAAKKYHFMDFHPYETSEEESEKDGVKMSRWSAEKPWYAKAAV